MCDANNADGIPEKTETKRGISRRGLFTGVLGAAGFLAVGGASVVNAPGAFAVSRPSIISTSGWGAAAARGSISMSSTPRNIVVHHMASSNSTGTSRSAALAIAKQVQGWHFANGWVDTGQHFSVSRGGYILEGRHRTIEGLNNGSVFPVGAHVGGHNSTSLGIETEGNFMSTQPTTAEWNALVALIAYLCQTYGLGVNSIKGHRDFGSTSCPGDAFYPRLQELRNAVSEVLGGGDVPPPPGDGDDPVTSQPWPLVKNGARGFRVTGLQRLLKHHGQSLGVDGVFGSETLSRVRSFQKAKGLVVDGAVGPKTWKALSVLLKNGARGNAVSALQGILNSRGQSLAVDGSFGPATLTAVKSFQKARGLAVDGVVGDVTWSHGLRA
ncbi:peptidoglycan recognition protein family protein [Agrococcus casei]|uniref:peptidoglycan recognition protein family protein n=1 Tax=Agrococcus casei TaxID=343512 RepID=UPI003F92FA7B